MYQSSPVAKTEAMNLATQAQYLERNFVLPPAYNTRADIATQDKLIEECQEKQNEAIQAYNRQMERQNEFEAKLNTATQVYNELVQKEADLRGQIAKLQSKSVKHFDKTTDLQTS